MRIAGLICSLFLAVGLLAIPAPSRAQVAVGISVRFGPPVLPVYVQPICPAPGFIWIPGYWAYGPDGYFWVPGTWVEPPEVGLFWTPGYWGWEDDLYVWYPGYWGPEVGYYGGINYGFGYTGVGFFGGYWRGRTYYYNRSVTNVNVAVVHNTYNTTVINNNTTVNRVSFNGGPGGTTARPTATELAAARQHHIPMTSVQTQHQQAAGTNRTLLASVNHGRPDIAATPRAGVFNGPGEVSAGRSANPNRPAENRREEDRKETAGPVKPSENSARTEHGGRTFEDRPPSARPSSAPHVNPALEQKHQRETEKLHQQQDAERQKIQQQHARDQQKLQQRNANQQRQAEVQRRQQQQLQQMQQKHDQQAQKLQERQQREVQRQEPKPQSKPPKSERPPGQSR